MKQRSLEHYLGVGYFVHPVPLIAVAILALNDHFLKYQFPSEFTGKLSDVAGLFLFPLFLVALVCLTANLIQDKRESIYWINRPLLVGAILVTAAIFSAVKLSHAAADFYLQTLGRLGFPSRIVMDPSDLWTLFILIFTYWYGSRFFATE